MNIGIVTDGCGTRVVGRDYEQRIRALEAEVAALKHECESLRKLLGERQAFPVQGGDFLPSSRKAWTVTATSQPHHPVDWSRPIGPDSWKASLPPNQEFEI